MPFDDTTPRDDRDDGREYHFVIPYAAVPGTTIIGYAEVLVVTFVVAAAIPAGTVATLSVTPHSTSVTYRVGEGAITTTATVEWRR